MIRFLRILVRFVFVVVVLVAVVGGGLAAITLDHFGRDLPDHEQISHYVPAIGSKVYAGDGSLMAEFASEHRIFVPINKIPPLVTRAFLAAEDRDFYNHNGVNPFAIFRAGLTDVLRLHKGQRPMGASTITQQVVRHFLLTNEVSVSRKIKEAMLAYRIDKTLSKDRILEIYLNEIYFGAGAYGVAAAADTYFQKPLDQLSVSQIAFLAALPKAPNNYNPTRHARAAKARRDYVLSGMAEAGWITADQAKTAMGEPLDVHIRTEPVADQNGYFAEEVRREIIGRFGENKLYEGGLTIRTSYRADYQQMAETAYHSGLVEYDRRHGWRGPISHQASATAAQAALATANDRPGLPTWRIAAVTEVDASGAQIALKGGGEGRIPVAELRWARRTLPDQRLGSYVRNPHDVLAVGDIIFVEPLATSPATTSSASRKGAPPAPAVAQYALRQIPDVSGGFVALDPKTGRVFATVGGWDFGQSQFNRATQAKRQPGSAFKPFVYLTALQNGFTPWSVLDNSPIELSQGPGLPPWRPVNYEGETSGPATLHDALMHSYNLVTARLASMIGMPAIGKTVEAFDVMDRMPLYYSMALGAGETTLLRLTTAYAMIDNGGHWLLPSLIDTVQDRDGRIIYQKGAASCHGCFIAEAQAGASDASALYRAAGPPEPTSAKVPNAKFADNAILYRPTKPDPLADQQADYELVSMMQDVVLHGTGNVVAAVGKPLAGKTGTTSDFFDAWFVGFSPDLAAGGYVGFDQPRTLGRGESGGHVTAPIFRDFMAAALKNAPATPFPTPPNDSSTATVASNNNGTMPTTLRGAKNADADSNSDWSANQANADPDNAQDAASGSTVAMPTRNAGWNGRSNRNNNQTARYSDDPNAAAYQDPSTRAYQDPSARAYQDPNTRGYQDPKSRAYQAPSARANQDPNVRPYQDPISRYAQEQAPYSPPARYTPPPPSAYAYPPQVYGYAPQGYAAPAYGGGYGAPAYGYAPQYADPGRVAPRAGTGGLY